MRKSSDIVLAFALAVLGMAVFAASAHAVEITNTTQGTTLFNSHGFEFDTVGQDAATANPGFWSNTGLPVDEVVTGGVPGAFEGDNYLSTERGFVNAGNPRAFFSPQGTNGDQIHAEWMMWIPDPADIGFFLDDNSVGGTPLIQTRMGSGGPIVQHLDDTGVFANMTPVLNFTQQTWQKWELDYTLGDSTFTVTVDGVSAEGGVANPTLTAADHLSFFHNGLQTYFIDAVESTILLTGDANKDGQVTGADLISVQQNFGNVLGPGSAAVPEPATLALLMGIGALAMTRRLR